MQGKCERESEAINAKSEVASAESEVASAESEDMNAKGEAASAKGGRKVLGKLQCMLKITQHKVDSTNSTSTVLVLRGNGLESI